MVPTRWGAKLWRISTYASMQWQPTLQAHDPIQIPIVIDNLELGWYPTAPDIHLINAEVVTMGASVKDITLSSSLNNDIVDYFLLNEVSGDRVGAAKGIVLTDVNTVTSTTAFGRTVAQFTSANSESLRITNVDQAHTLFRSYDITICVWVNMSAAGLLVQMHIGGLQPDGWRWAYVPAEVRSHYGPGFVSMPDVIVADTWYFLVGQHNKANRKGSVNDSVFTTAVGGNIGLPTTFRLGTSSTGSNFYDGLMCNYGVWTRELTASEITRLYNNGTPLGYPF